MTRTAHHLTTTTSNLEDIVKRFQRSTIGSDYWFVNTLDGLSATENYPPYNLERYEDDGYRLTFAVAGFTKDELSVTVEEGSLIVTGNKEPATESSVDHFIHRGIAFRSFKREFKLAEYVVVESSKLEHGILEIFLRRILPEALKPQTIEIK